ncbi:MAG: hypothetical protein P4L30_04380 [Candidatus Limnocylindrales bacterium]|nr:hypothetical protein [Candidatus Limnocylindrales bacterium]
MLGPGGRDIARDLGFSFKLARLPFITERPNPLHWVRAVPEVGPDAKEPGSGGHVAAEVDDVALDLDIELVARLEAQLPAASLGTAIWCLVLILTPSMCAMRSSPFAGGKEGANKVAGEPRA